MDGQNRTKLVDSKIVFPHGITLDLVSRLVYWTDPYLDYIEVVDYEGNNRHTIISGPLVRTIGVCCFFVFLQTILSKEVQSFTSYSVVESVLRVRFILFNRAWSVSPSVFVMAQWVLTGSLQPRSFL